MTGVLALLRSALAGGSIVALPAALAGGILTGLNPCCLPLFPAAAATCCAVGKRDEKRSVGAAVSFVVGMAMATTALGVAASATGRTMAALGGSWAYALALVPLAAGANLLGWLPLPRPRLWAPGRLRGLPGAFLAGLVLSLVFGSCGTPILAAILSYAAYQHSLPYGGVLLFVYGLGASLPVLVFGATAAKLASRLAVNGLRLWVDRVTGVILLGVGFYLLWTA